MYEIKFVKETAAIILTKDGEYIDSVFLNKYEYDHGLLAIDHVKFEVSKLASIHNVEEYILNIEEF